MNRVDTGLLDGMLEEEKQYWIKKMSGSPGPTSLPVVFNAAGRGNEETGALRFDIDPRTAEKLLRICGGNEELVLTSLVTALKICLHKYTGQEDIIVGTAIHDRYREVAHLNGALALRDTVRGRMTVRQLLMDVKRTLSEAYSNQKYPYASLVEMLGAESKTDIQSLFDVAIVLENINDKKNLASVDNALTMTFALSGESLGGEIAYDTTSYDERTIRIFEKQFQRVLQSIADAPEIEVSEIELLSADEKRRLIYEFNDSHADYPREKTIHQLFEEQAERSPDRVAIAFDDREITFRELESAANRLAHYLIKRGIGASSLVGIFMEHSIETVIALLGVLKSGAAYVPLDPEHPMTRLAFVIENARLPVILTQSQIAERLPNGRATLIYMDSDWPLITQEDDGKPGSQIGVEDLAYVIHTSGSTGEPKGVEIQHCALVNYIWWAKQMYLRDEELAFPLYSPLAFDLTVTMIYLPLITGNTIFVYPHIGRDVPLMRILEEGRVGVLKLTPSHLSLIKERDNRASGVRRLIVGGEAFETGMAREVAASFGPETEIFNEYGPTEATVGCMIHRYDPAQDDGSQVPIGKPAANAQIYVLDENLNPVPENMSGEIFISGDGVARGYLNREDLTAERFIANPFIPGTKMYRTGDLARWLPEGILEYIGRNDDQIKFHGHRVELNEIRCALNRRPRARDSVVRVMKDRNGFDILVAYYVSDQEIQTEDWRTFLSGQIIEETIPNIFVRIEKMPLTLNGKIDFLDLPDIEEARRSAQQSYVAPRTPTEATVAAIWSEVLGLPQVGIHDNFFSLGGHSLIATQVIARMQSAFHLEIPMRLILDRPTVADIALAVTEIEMEQEADFEIADLLEEIENLTEEELEHILAQEASMAAGMEAK